MAWWTFKKTASADVATPAAGKISVFIQSDGTPSYKDETGTVTSMVGAAGPTGAGVPTGGTAGQVLEKIDGTNYNTQWATPAAGGGSGDVVGPASATSGNIALFDGTTGKLIKDGGKSLADLTAIEIVSAISSGTITPTGTTDLIRPATLTAALTIANPSSTPADGAGFVVDLIDNGTTRALTWGSKYANSMSTLPTTTTVSKRHRIGFEYNAADDKLYCMYAQVQS